MSEYTVQRLQEWAALLKKEGNSLGESLSDYAEAWLGDLNMLDRAEAEIKRLRAALGAASQDAAAPVEPHTSSDGAPQEGAQPVAYLLGTKSKPDWPYHSRVLVFAHQTTIAGVPAVDDHLARDTGQIHEAVPLYAHPPVSTHRPQAEIERLREAIRDVAELAGWHSDDEADANDQSPEDMTAHVNGLIRQTCWRALNGDPG